MDMNELRAARARRRLSQQDVSKLMGLPVSKYGKKEIGKCDFTIEDIIKLSEIFGFTFNDVNHIFFDDRLIFSPTA